MPNAKEVGFMISFLTLAGGALLGATGELLIGALLGVAGAIGSFIFDRSGGAK